VKGIGYMVSSVSVLLLAVSPLKTALEEPLLLACLVGGVVLSILGMALRYLSHRRDKLERDREREEQKSPPAVPPGGPLRNFGE
jgi:uncharacterized protein (DUF2062 family)